MLRCARGVAAGDLSLYCHLPTGMHRDSRLFPTGVGQLCGLVYMHAGCGRWPSAELLQFPSLVCRSSLHGDSCADFLQVNSGAATAAVQFLRRLSTTITVTAQAQSGLMSLGQQPVPALELSSPAVMGACCPQPLLTMAFVTAVMERMRAHICNAHIPVSSPDLISASTPSGSAVLCPSVTFNTFHHCMGTGQMKSLLVNISPCSVTPAIFAL